VIFDSHTANLVSDIREVEKPTPEALYALQHEKAKHERARRAAENLENRKALMLKKIGVLKVALEMEAKEQRQRDEAARRARELEEERAREAAERDAILHPTPVSQYLARAEHVPVPQAALETTPAAGDWSEYQPWMSYWQGEQDTDMPPAEEFPTSNPLTEATAAASAADDELHAKLLGL
jgi:hypothetical protein